MCKPVYAIDTPAGRIGIFEGDESEDFHGIRIFWIDENDAVIDLIAMIEGESANYLEWTRDRREFSKCEIRIHVPAGSIAQGEYDIS